MSIEPPRPIKLYSNKSCPWAQRCRIALLEAKVKYEEIEIDLQNKPEWHWKLNNVKVLRYIKAYSSKGKFPF
jgi:glutaredoxin